MKRYYLLMVVFISSLMLINSCDDENGNVSEDLRNSSEVLKNSDPGTVETDNGIKIIVQSGAIADQGRSEEAEVVFSIEETNDPIVELPSNFTKVGNYVKFGPDGFVFHVPITLMLPGDPDDNPAEYSIAYLDPGTESWELIPITQIDGEKYLVGTDVYKLGTFALVKPNRDGSFNNKSSDGFQADCESCDGGVKLNPVSPYSSSNYFVLTISSVNFKYSWAEQYFHDLVGSSAATPSNAPATAPNHPLKWRLPQGNYSFYVSALIPDGPYHKKWMTYTIPAEVNVNRPVSYSSWTSQAEGWYNVSLPAGGQWVEARPENIPEATTPVGTGQFQATLSWVNTSSSNADLDLHLYGPNGLHVYYNVDYTEGDYYRLDRDWQSDLGNAIENIFSVESNLPTGDYRVVVHHYSGSLPKSYNVRIVNGSSVRSFSGRMNEYDEEREILKFRIN